MTLPDRHPTINRGSGADVDVGDDDEADGEGDGAAVEQILVACPNGSLLSWNRRIFGLVATGISVLLVAVPPILLVAVERLWSCASAAAIYEGSAGNASGTAAADDDADG
jgi:hypothetical protein